MINKTQKLNSKMILKIHSKFLDQMIYLRQSVIFPLEVDAFKKSVQRIAILMREALLLVNNHEKKGNFRIGLKIIMICFTLSFRIYLTKKSQISEK